MIIEKLQKNIEKEVLEEPLFKEYFDRFEMYEQVINQQSQDIEYVNDEKREKGILEIRKKVEETLLQNKSSFIRIEGFSGIGKTRFVYESLNDNKFKEFVLYVKSFKDSILNDLVSFAISDKIIFV